MTPVDQLRLVLTQVRDQMCAEAKCLPWDINNGRCEEFASAVLDLVSAAEEMSTPEDADAPGHVWITFAGRHYDAQTVDGVADWMTLPIFRRVPR